MRNVQKEFFERSLKRQGVTVSVNGVETKALIINEKDIKTSWCYSDIILPYEIKAEIGDIIHVGDKRFFICNKDTQYDIRNLYRCCENVHYVRFDYQNGTIKSAGLVTLTEDKVTSLFDNALLELAKGVAIFNIKHTANTEQIEVGDRFVLMNRAYEVIGCTWGTQNLIKLELEKSTWGVDDDKENGIIVNKREVRLEEEPDTPDVPEEPTEPINDTIVGDDSIDVGATATYTITNTTGANVTWSVDNTNVTITSSDNTSCTIEGVTDGSVTISVAYPTGEVFSKSITINATTVYEISGVDEFGLCYTEEWTIPNPNNLDVTWTLSKTTYTDILEETNTSIMLFCKDKASYVGKKFTITATYSDGLVLTKEITIVEG